MNKILEAITDSGGRPFIVGGAVRDHLLGLKPKDTDVEVYGLPLDGLQDILSRFGTVDLVGKSFGVLKLHEFPNVDFSIPRRDNKNGIGHRGFTVVPDPSLTVEEAAKRRDLTINSMLMNPFTHEIIDPFRGQRDLKDGVLRATDPKTFLEDPLRVLRVAQLISRFGFCPDLTLEELCFQANLDDLPGERIWEEFKKLLLGKNPCLGLESLRTLHIIGAFPELEALVGCPQDREWHPEGDVWTHTCMAVGAARGLTDDIVILLAVLCHDFGKPATTTQVDGIRSHGHEDAGEGPTRSFLKRLRVSEALTEAVVVLVKKHLTPARFYQTAKAPAYRRLARKLEQAGITLKTLETVARADHFGRTTPEAIKMKFPAGDEFLRVVQALKIETRADPDIVMGRHLIARGLSPGHEFGIILKECRNIQDELGLFNPDAILELVLSGR